MKFVINNKITININYFSYLRYKTGSNVFMDELVNYRSSPIGRDL
jgi:hypothetical protein